MENNIPIRSLLILLFFAICNLLETTRSQTTRPFCYTQISAANQACSILSPNTISHELVADNSTRHNVHDDDGGGGDDGDGGDDDGGGGGDDDHGGDDEGGGGGDDEGGDDGHGGDDEDHGDDDDDDDDHHHHHRRHKHGESSANKECCRWLKEVDNDCVCEVLLKLPPFLVRPKHTYVIKVGRECRMTYNCPGMLPIPRERGV